MGSIIPLNVNGKLGKCIPIQGGSSKLPFRPQEGLSSKMLKAPVGQGMRKADGEGRGHQSRAGPGDRELERGLAGDVLSHMTTGASRGEGFPIKK